MRTLPYIWCTVVALAAPSVAAAVDFDSFESDAETDQWLRQASPMYATMVKDIESRDDVRGYRFATKEDISAGNVSWVDGFMEIQLSADLAGPLRITTLIFEMANAYRSPEHQAIDLAADKGLIRTPEEFGLAHEIYEYEALRLQRQVLIEIESRAGALPKDFFYLITPPPDSAVDYRLPGLYQYLKTQQESGHTAHYHRWFHFRTSGQEAPSESPEGAENP